MKFKLSYVLALMLMLLIAVSLFSCGSGKDSDVSGFVKVLDPGGDYITWESQGRDPNRFYDIISMEQWIQDNNLMLVLEFDKDVILPPPGEVPSDPILSGFIWFDTDQDGNTGGGNPLPSLCSNAPSLDGDYVIVFFSRLANGNYEIQDDRGFEPVTGEAVPSASSNILSLTIPLSALGDDDGNINVYAVLGMEQTFATDCAPGGAPLSRI